ncbi:Mismatch repair-related protein [Mycena venus]|uniref:Mismatch repair-related protein n=1 Tax=Mycena venus TaxID=2733690 RepID=A0A8H6Y5W6_9AGAR|nr:Mismatch repair-related protein [Mycena venus]
MDAAIEPLPDVTRTKLRSTQILTSLSQIVSELLQNSLDAGAHQIDIGVDCEEWTCWVRDDGSGMSKDGMDILGTGLEAGRYGTSKAYAPDSLNDLSTFGFRGEALASCADICCLEISSRTARSRQTWSVIVKGSKTLYNGPAVRWRPFVDFICILISSQQLPVRRLSHPTPVRTLDAIRHEIEAFALVFPNVAFTLENTHSVKDDKDMLLRIPKTTSMLTAFRHLYGRALAQHVEEIDVTSGELRLKGFISLDGAFSKAYQFLYINRHPISLCELHHVIDSRFASSSFAKHAFDEAGETSLRSTVRRSPRKSEKKPVYVLDLSVPSQEIDNCLEPAKAAVHLRNKNAVASLLSSTIQAFLARHGFAADSKATHGVSPSPSPRKRRKYDFEDDSGYAELEPPSRQLSREASPAPLYTSEETEELQWTDPHTGQIYIVDARTGNSYKQFEPPPVDFGGVIAYGPQGRTLSRQKARGNPDMPAMPEWIQNALEANDIYAVAETKIPSLTHLPAPDADAVETHQHDCHSAQKFSDYLKTGQPYGGSTSASSRRFQKDDLRNAQVIDQVDRKFIACVINDSFSDTVATRRTLVLIDQHAADERVRVEKFLKELCLGYLANVDAGEDKKHGLRLKDLSPPIPILLTRHEERQLREHSTRRVFGHWGFHFVEPSGESSDKMEQDIDAGGVSGYTQAFVRCVPVVVANKLLLDDELRDFVKAFLAKLESDIPRAEAEATEDDEDDEFHWLRALRWCPQQLLDLVNSKACRGAIMFNDSLTHAQCEKLVDNLCKTAFPFQCAHGRPSLVPLIDLGNDNARRRRTCRWFSLDDS